jgi:CTP synthase (UTP-ammonia lyase)
MQSLTSRILGVNLIPGVISGVGKGIIGTRQMSSPVTSPLTAYLLSASSSGLLLKTLGLKVTAIKIDPYLNIDAGMAGWLVFSQDGG